MKRKLLITLLFSIPLLFFSLSAQELSVNGFVYDDSNGEALIGANVYIQELGIGASTNNSGYFVIPNVPKGEVRLICSYISYEMFSQDIIVSASRQSTLKIYLKPSTVQTEEVVVTGDSIPTIEKMFAKPISRINLNAQQINQIPRMIEADLLRSLQTMPGIMAISDFSSALYIRGGTPDQNLFMIDGTDVYNPEHAFGIFSTFNTNAIKKVELSKGGFGAEYGGRLSSVLDITNIDGNRKEFEGVANVSLLSASTTLQLPIGDLGSISGSIRRTHIDQTYAKWVDEIPDYYFYDANLKSFLDLDTKNKLTLSFFNSQDNLDFKADKDAEESFGFLYDWGNTTGSVNWKHIFGPKLFTTFWLTASRYQSNFNLEDVNFSEDNYLSDYSMKLAAEYYYSNNLRFKIGAEQKVLHEKYSQLAMNQKIIFNNHRQLTSGHVSANWKPTPDLEVEAGLRANYFNSDTTYFNLSPRFSAKYRLTESSNLKFATGVYHQYINRLPRLFFASIWITSNKYDYESSSNHFVLGYQKEFGEVWEFEVEAYYKTYKNIHQFNQHIGTEVQPAYYESSGKPVYNSPEFVFNTGDGRSYGLEFMLRRDIGAVTGWLSYSYAVTKFNFDKINQGNDYYPRHDRTSVLNLVANFELMELWDEIMGNKHQASDTRWMFGCNFIYTSGQPITTPSSAYYANALPDWADMVDDGETNPAYKLYPGEINSFRLPAYMRMDLSVTYEIQYDGWKLSPYLQIINAGDRKNTWFIMYNEDEVDGIKTQEIEKVPMLPILPSFGVNIEF